MTLQHALAPLAALASLAVLAAAAPAHAAPDAALFAAAQAQQAPLVETLKALVSIESGSTDLAGLAKLASVIDDRLKAIGFTTERRKATAGPGADIVIATMKGSGKRRIMLQAHMDTVYERGILQGQPIRQDGKRLYGPGIADDKGGIAVILHAIKILNDAGWKDYETLTVLVDPDEEIGSIGSGETIAALADQHDVVLSCEPTGTREVNKVESLLLGAAGTATITMEVKGRASHAGAAPELGRNAIYELAHQMLQTRDLAKEVPGTIMNWTNVVSNKARNQIPEVAVATADVRLLQAGAEKQLHERLQAKIAASRLVPDTTTTATLRVGRPTFVANDAGKALAARAQAIYREMDRDLALVPMVGGATDAAFAGRSGTAAVVESFGLAGHGYHARDEYIDVESIVPRLYLMARLMQEIGKP